MLTKIGDWILGVLQFIGAATFFSVLVGLMIHLIRFAWSAF